MGSALDPTQKDKTSDVLIDLRLGMSH